MTQIGAEEFGGILAGFGALGCIGFWFLVIVAGMIIPIWAIIECATSERSDGPKTVWIICLVIFWGLGSIVYGIFGTRSKALRLTTIISSILLVILLISSVALMGVGGKMSQEAGNKRRLEEYRERLTAFSPEPAPANTIATFKALQIISQGTFQVTTAIADFQQDGLIVSSAQAADKGVRHISIDPVSGKIYALTNHDFGQISSKNGEFQKIEPWNDMEEISWPGGVAFDSKRERVLIVSKSGKGHIFSYEPKDSHWSVIGSMDNLDIVALSYLPEADSFFAVPLLHPGKSIDQLLQLSPEGAVVKRIPLKPAIPLRRHDSHYVQLQSSSGKLVLLLSAKEPKQNPEIEGMFIIDPESGTLMGTPNVSIP